MSGALFRNYITFSLSPDSPWRSSQINERYFSGTQKFEDLTQLKNICGEILKTFQ